MEACLCGLAESEWWRQGAFVGSFCCLLPSLAWFYGFYRKLMQTAIGWSDLAGELAGFCRGGLFAGIKEGFRPFSGFLEKKIDFLRRERAYKQIDFENSFCFLSYL